ncbi:MAG: ribonuclease HI family protein [candidate division WOR-3 bacterium]
MNPDDVVVYIDGSSSGNPGPSGIGIVIFDRHNSTKPLAQISRYIGITTNNVAEYEALINALKWLSDNKFLNAEIYMDSELVYKQLIGNYRIKTPHIKSLADRVRKLLNKFEKIDLKMIPREKNRLANLLAQRIVRNIKKKKEKDSKK